VSLEHLIREPAGAPAGALILSHGRGADEADLHPLLDLLDPDRRLLGLTPGAPLTNVPPGGRHWYLVPQVGHPDPETFQQSYALLTGFLDRMLEERSIAWERTVVGGFSMGAVMSYAVGLGEGRPPPGGLIALSGFVPTVDGWRPELASRKGLEVLIHHGRLDPIIDVGFAHRARELLEAGGLEVDYTESEVAHALPPELLPRLRGFVDRVIPAAGQSQA
jgi:phospholipase/carboxylesterase